jgi:p-aminobenzoyl-glutamate transporter AbgT
VTCHLVTLAKDYSGLGSLTFRSSISKFFFVEELVCKMIPYSSFSFPCCIVLIIVWFVLDFRIHVYCLECGMRMLRLGYLF